MIDPITALRRMQKKQGLSQAEMAQNIGVSAPFLCEVLASRKRPSPKILEYLGMVKSVTYSRGNGKARK